MRTIISAMLGLVLLLAQTFHGEQGIRAQKKAQPDGVRVVGQSDKAQLLLGEDLPDRLALQDHYLRALRQLRHEPVDHADLRRPFPLAGEDGDTDAIGTWSLENREQTQQRKRNRCSLHQYHMVSSS